MSAHLGLTDYPRFPKRTPNRVRQLSASELGIDPPGIDQPSLDATGSDALETGEEQVPPPPPPPPADVQQLLDRVLILLDDGYAGIVFTGPPGTSKSWYAEKVARELVDHDDARVRFVQFHPSYQYEDFVEGLVPLEVGEFIWKNKHLLSMADDARQSQDLRFVLVIDELSRADPGRVFGEALTYIEVTRRDHTFWLASGRTTSIPPNLVILATMNLFDRGVDEVDAALERRFAKIRLNPDRVILDRILKDNGLEDLLRVRVLAFFDRVQQLAKKRPLAQLGHAYFRMVKDKEGLERLWEYQLSHFFERAYRFEEKGYDEVKRSWDRIFFEESESSGTDDG
jgi:5-methylcytosine-specific restriction enzyme B